MSAAELAEKLGAWADLLEVNSDTRWTPDACVWIRQAAARLRSMEEALSAIANHPTGGVGCNPEEFVAAAKAALGGA